MRTQVESFDRTLMGKIGKTQKGKFDCENCHGPGSAHVKAGGGRGVGGIISFRPDDLSRTAEENNRICLGCHEKGNRTNWHGSTHDERGLMCSNCHTVMKNVSRKAQLKTAFQPDTCFQCHKNKRARCGARRTCRCARARLRAPIATIRTAAIRKIF